jgi:flagella basal body P-ring formation protein FlgA
MTPILFLALLAAPAFQNLDAVERAVVIAAGADIGAPGGPVAPVDRRLKLAACPQVTADPPYQNAITVRCPAIGWRLRVPLSRGAQPADEAPARAVSYARPERAEPVIRRGDPVDLEAGSGAFVVSTQAVAQEDGAPGARIRVKSDGKSAVILAEVVESGRVRVPGFK